MELRGKPKQGHEHNRECEKTRPDLTWTEQEPTWTKGDKDYLSNLTGEHS